MDSFTNATNLTIGEGDTTDVLLVLSYIITIVINTIICPFIVLLNVLVIMTMKTRSRLQTNSNISLSCLAVTEKKKWKDFKKKGQGAEDLLCS